MEIENRMPLDLYDLDRTTRKLMLREIAFDEERGGFYLSPRLSEKGRKDYRRLLTRAVVSYGDQWLADQLRTRGRINETQERRNPRGGVMTVKMPVNAPDILAQGEFNRYYLRALCLRAVKRGDAKLIVHRARHSAKPRPESQRLEGTALDARRLLRDLRRRTGAAMAGVLPVGPNSGLSARLPRGG